MFIPQPNGSPAKRNGLIAALLAVVLTVLVTCLAFALDGGILLQERRNAQATADAAALAAAEDLYVHYGVNAGLDPNHTAKNNALAIASANGYANDGTSSTVTVNIPPLSGNFVGKAGYAEVLVQWNQTRSFSSVFAGGTMPVKARAVARGQWIANQNGVILLDSTHNDWTMSGNHATLSSVNAPVTINSNLSSDAADGIINSPTIYHVGDVSQVSRNDGGAQSFVSIPNPIPDPLAYLPEPDAVTLGLPTNPPSLGTDPITGNAIYGPGLYTSVPGGGGGVTFQADLVHYSPNAQVAIIQSQGGWDTMSQGTVVTKGVMIFADQNAGGTHFSGQSNVSLSAPTSGIYTGLGYFQDRLNNSTTIITGNATVTNSGTYYAATGSIDARGNGDVTLGSQLIINNGQVRGNGSVVCNYIPQNVAKTRIIQLVE